MLYTALIYHTVYQGDFVKGLVEPLLKQSYDFIVATYSLHHLTDEQKVSFLRVLCDHLKESFCGQILITEEQFAFMKRVVSGYLTTQMIMFTWRNTDNRSLRGNSYEYQKRNSKQLL